MFEKFKKPEDEAKRQTSVEVSQSSYENSDSVEMAKNHPKFKEVVNKIHELDRIYNAVDETKKNLINQILYTKVGWLAVGGGFLGSAEEIMRTGEVNTPAILSAVAAVLAGMATALRTNAFGRVEGAKFAHNKALNDRISHIIETDFTQPKNEGGK